MSNLFHFYLKTPILACIESHLFTVNSCKDIHLKCMSRVLMLWLVNVSQYRHSKSFVCVSSKFWTFLLLYFYLIHVKEVVPLHYCHSPHVLTENIWRISAIFCLTLAHSCIERVSSGIKELLFPPGVCEVFFFLGRLIMIVFLTSPLEKGS